MSRKFTLAEAHFSASLFLLSFFGREILDNEAQTVTGDHSAPTDPV